MKRTKRLILISLLLLLLAGAFLLDPLARFALALQTERFDHAEAVYLSRLCHSDHLRQEADEKLQTYVEHKLAMYYGQRLTYDEVMGVLQPLSLTKLPQDDIEDCRQAAAEMEAARTSLAQANACYAKGDYAGAIPLYRAALIADESVEEQLKVAEIEYKNHLLADAEAAMDSGKLTSSEAALLKGLEVLGEDGDLAAALNDVRRMAAEHTYNEQMAEARRRLQNEGPEDALRYVEDLRQQADDEYAWEYLEQRLLHEYETDICAKAQALREAGDGDQACAMLEEGLQWIDSIEIRTLLFEIRGVVHHPLGELPVQRDETANARIGKQSTIARDLYAMDNFSNTYGHSFSADMGAVSFSLQGAFDVFTGTVAFPQGEKSDLYRASATLQIIADGQLIAEFKNIDMTSKPTSFSLPVNDVDKLTLSWLCDGANGWRDWGRFATIFDGEMLSGVKML